MNDQLKAIFDKHPGPYRNHKKSPVVLDSTGGDMDRADLITLANAAHEQHVASKPEPVEERYYVEENPTHYNLLYKLLGSPHYVANYVKSIHPDARAAAEAEAARLNGMEFVDHRDCIPGLNDKFAVAREPTPELPERAKHTPEPWLYSDIFDNGGGGIVTEDNDIIVGGYGQPYPQRVADLKHAIACVNAEAGHKRVGVLARELAEYARYDGESHPSFVKELRSLALKLLAELGETEPTPEKGTR